MSPTRIDPPLDETDARVLGALIEKQVTTPDAYPLSLNALAAACNQSTNRTPVMALDEDSIVGATDRLRRQSLVRAIRRSDSRVMKYEHLAGEALDLSDRELAVLCVLLLRGPNTLAELRTRTERLASFDGVADVEATLVALSEREAAPLVVRLPRQPGQKEARYAQLLSGPVAADISVFEPVKRDRITELEESVNAMREELADLRAQLAEFRKQFE
jgi:hypothetical protein